MFGGKLTALLAAALLLTGCGKQPETVPHLRKCETMRIVSIAPNVTEILYELGLSNKTVGVSRYSHYPPEAKTKPVVGGTYDPNWEMIVSLQPDRVIGLDSQQEIAARLKQLDIDFLGVPHERVTEIMDSILIIGEACGAEEQAQKLFQSLKKNLRRNAIASKHCPPPPPATRLLPRKRNQETPSSYTQHPTPEPPLRSPPAEGCPQGGMDSKKPRVLICIGHDEQLTRMYVAARNTFYDDLITLAGGINACDQTAVKYPEISPEALHALTPDLIIDIAPDLPSDVSTHWKPYHAIAITNSYAFIPGPRFGFLLKDFVDAIQHQGK